jgi:hypothetical protein
MAARALRFSVALLSATLTASLASAARASDLSWSGPAECSEREQLLFQIERAIGAPLAQTAPFHFQVHVERTSPDLRARLLVRGDEATSVKERLLIAPDCHQLVDTLAIAIALAIEAARAETEARPSSVAPSQHTPGAQAANEPESSSAAAAGDPEQGSLESAASRPIVPRASLWVMGDLGSLPAPALGMAIGVELGWPGVQLRALGTLWLEQHAQLGSEATALGGDINLALGALLACTSPLSPSARVLLLSVCGGGEAGRLSGSGTGVSERRVGATLWLAPRVDSGIFWQLPDTRLRIGAQLSVVVPLVRDELALDQLGVVHQPASLVGRAAFGADVAFE